MAQDMAYVKRDVAAIKETVQNDYVTGAKFDALVNRVKLLERVVFGLIALILVAVFTQIINGVVNKTP